MANSRSSPARRGGPVQLDLEFPDDTGRRTGPFVLTRPLLKHRLRNSVMKKLTYVRRYFPELGNRTVRVGLTRVASGMAVPGGDELWLNPGKLSFHTITHELIHLLQARGRIPSGERSCDLFSLARHWTLNDTPPYYVSIPANCIDPNGKISPENARLIHAVASRALEMREKGTRNYIAYFEKTMKELVGEIPSSSPIRVLRPV